MKSKAFAPLFILAVYTAWGFGYFVAKIGQPSSAFTVGMEHALTFLLTTVTPAILGALFGSAAVESE